jgi:4-hydroxy-tetrahydrodipicolinate synthase
MKPLFTGLFTALITPFKEDGDVDFAAYERLIDRQIKRGVDGLVPCGTTGETPTLSEEEHLAVVECCIKAAAGKVPVIAGAGSNNTAKTIDMVNKISKLGADGVLIVTPYYNKPSQEGLYQHYKTVHDSSDIPVMLYNVPSRTGVDIACETVIRLSELPRIVGLKDASGKLERPAKLKILGIREDFALLSGNDDTALAFCSMGGVGCVSVTSNVCPDISSAMFKALKVGDYATAKIYQDRLAPLNEALFCETNPVPCKFALSELGLCSAKVRLPLWEISDNSKTKVRTALEKVF